MVNIGIFGLGEAGSLFAADLIAAGITVKAFDPAEVATPVGVTRCQNPVDVVQDADFIFALTAAKDSHQALDQALDTISPDSVYADFSTASCSLKQELAAKAEQAGFLFSDVALLAIVPGNGIHATALASGTGSEAFTRLMQPLGMPVTAIGPQAGDAATRKLLRSVMMKGLAAVVIESMRGAEAAGCSEWLWENLAGEISGANESTLARLINGTGLHAGRRLHEMEASLALLQELNVNTVMTRSTVESLRQVLHKGAPEIPGKISDFPSGSR